MQKMFFIVEKDSLDFQNVLQNGSFKNFSLKGYFGNQQIVLWHHYKNTLLEALLLRV